MPPETILFIDQYPGVSGGQKVLYSIIDRLSKKGFHCVAALPEEGLLSRKLSGLGIKTVFLPIGYYSITRKTLLDLANYLIRTPLLIYLLIKLINREKPALVYANGARVFFWSTLACHLAKTPVIWHLHSLFDKGMMKNLCLYFGRYSVVKKIIAVSKTVAAPLSSLNQKIEVVYNGVELSSETKGNSLIKDEFNLPPSSFLIGNVGILEEWKNQEDLLRAAGVIKKSGKGQVYFFLIGDSLHKQSSRQEYKKKLKKLSRDTGLENRVFFLGFRQDIPAIMRSLDLLVICSRDPDPCPLVSLEAAESGLPIIATNHGGVKEMFIEGSEALFYPPGKYDILSSKIISCLEDRQLTRNLSALARQKARDVYSLDKFLEKIESIIKNSININEKKYQ